MPITATIELELSAGVWTDISADVYPGWSGQYGISGSGPTDRCAGSGTFRFTLRNDAGCSGGLQGYYSPGHANCRAGFDLGTMFRIKWTDGVSTVTRGIGRIVSLIPTTGKYGVQRVHVEGVDWLDEAAITTVQGVATQTNKRADEILTALLAGASTNPEAVNFDTGDSTFAYALDNLQDESTRLLTAFATLAHSEGGFIYLLGDGTLRFVKRTGRASTTASEATFDETMQGMTVRRSREDIVNRILVTVHPRRIDAAATTVLYSLDTQPQIDVGQTIRPFGPYGDPSNGNKRCGGTAMVSPAATTDYTMNSQADGLGTDLTASLSVTANYGGNGVSWVLTNNAAMTGYITKLQCRGKGIYDYQNLVMEATDAASILAYGERLASVDMPYQDDAYVGDGFASYLLNLYASPIARAQTLSFYAQGTAAAMAAALAVDVGDRITVSETMSAVDADFFVQAISYEVGAGTNLWITFALAPADADTYWLLGTAGASELDLTTRLGFA